MKILAIIPARSGSKTIPNKNIRLFAGKPLLTWSIQHAKTSKYITRTIVSTDDVGYQKIAIDHGADAPFLRPQEYSQDISRDLEVFKHAIEWLKENEKYEPDLVVHLWPTCPVRKPDLIDKTIDCLLATPAADSIRTIVKAKETPFKMWMKGSNGNLQPVIQLPGIETYNMPRQELPITYNQNACVQVFRTQNIFTYNSMSGKNILGFEMDDFFDIDDEQDWIKAEQHVRSSKESNPFFDKRQIMTTEDLKTFCFDIDGVIASITQDNNYTKSAPVQATIDAIRLLHSRGHKIVLFTARGSKTGIDWRELTERQMIDWGVPYDTLQFGKPAADFYIDDRMVSIEEIQKIRQPTNDIN